MWKAVPYHSYLFAPSHSGHTALHRITDKMLQNRTMESKRGNFNMKKVPIRSFNLRSLSTANKISLKKKLTAELALVRSAIDKIRAHIPRTEQCCKRASNNTIRSSSTRQQKAVPANRKRKSSEKITQVQKKVKNANSISNVAHLNSQANPNNALSEVATNTDSNKKSVRDLRKKNCSDSNGFPESLTCENLISPTKALRAAKLKSRFADTILKAQLELQNNGLKERAFRMQREKDKLTKAYEEEQIRIEEQIKTDAAQKEKSKVRLMKIKKEREASRLALEKMERTVEMNDFNQVMRELKGLGCQNNSFHVLRQLGLFLKDDDFDDHETAQISVRINDEIEEGEICI